MKIRVIALVVSFATLACIGIGTVSAATTHYVNPGESIQTAVDNANAGDTIIVRAGTYTGSINVYKRLTVQSENGAGSVIVRASEGNVFEVIADHVNITGFTIEDASFSCGVLLFGVNDCDISNNIVSGNYQGIYLSKSSRNTIFNNNAFSNENNGIYLEESNGNKITDNDASNNVNYNGIVLDASNSNEISNNSANSNNYQGIGLWSSSENIMANNMAKNNGECGIYIEESNSNKITGNDASNNVNYNGIVLNASNSNEISNNSANSNNYQGIGLWSSSENTIVNNTAENNGECGIYIEESNGNTIGENIACNNEYGIVLNVSSSNTLRNNLLYDNRYNFGVEGDSYSDFDNDIDTSNTVDGKPIYYWIGRQDEQIPDDAGVVGVVNSINITVRDLTLLNNLQGVLFAYTTNSKIENVTALNNWDGIRLMSSTNNTLTNNNVLGNDCDGIWLWDSSNYNLLTGNTASNNNQSGIWIEESNSNKIYLNNFINNNDTVYSENSTNIWNSTEEITYTYNGCTYTNYLGNYWSDYKDKYPYAEEIDGCGIWDTPYSIESDKDTYPLMKHWENYFVATENVFETGQSENPYPSLSGTHNGTIKLNQTIRVSKLYTYPCVGTGGHTEYAKIYNDSWCVETLPWVGYTGDWHNISFSESFKLYPNNEYSYTIKTGSYPQIIHKQNHTTLDGSLITCTEFIGVNRKRYDDWIPAIALTPPDASDAVLILHFDEGSGTIAKDESGYGNDGTIYGATWTTGVSGKALEFDGVDDYVEIPDEPSLDLDHDFTIMAWANLDTGSLGNILCSGSYCYPSNPTIINKEIYTGWASKDVNYQTNYYMMINSKGAFNGGFEDNDVSTSDNVIQEGMWCFYALVLDETAGKLRLYVNGELKEESNYVEGDPRLNDVSVVIGRYGINYDFMWHWFNGTIDEVCIYNRALTADKIQSHYEGKQAALTRTETASPY